jgi:hypothetical protein
MYQNMNTVAFGTGEDNDGDESSNEQPPCMSLPPNVVCFCAKLILFACLGIIRALK